VPSNASRGFQSSGRTSPSVVSNQSEPDSCIDFDQRYMDNDSDEGANALRK
jgi:hypothetical protein